MDYAFGLAIPCLISVYIVNTYINEYINRTNKKAFLLYIIVGVCALCIVILPISTISMAYFNYKQGQDILKIEDFCK